MKSSRQSVLLAIPFFLAAFWALGVGLYLLFAPHGTGLSTTTGPGGQITQSVVRSSFYDVQGQWGVFLLAVFALLYIFTALSASLRFTALLVITSVAACVLTIMSGLSIGLLYFPAMFAVMAGWMVLGISRLWRYCLRPYPVEGE